MEEGPQSATEREKGRTTGLLGRLVWGFTLCGVGRWAPGVNWVGT